MVNLIPNSATLTGFPWDRLPEDIVEIILGKFWTGDRVRLRLVCKSWNRILIQPIIPTAPEAPWEILSDDSCDNSQSYMTQVCFRSLSEKRIYRFDLPILRDNSNRGCLSRGWLVLAVGPNLNPDIFLWNPLSGATRKLPPLSTLPFFGDFEESAGLGIPGLEKKIQNFTSVILKAEIFSIGSIECVVAVLFRTSRGKRIALCTPHHQVIWTPVNVDPVVEEEKQVNIEFEDILFHTSREMLVALVINPFSTVSAVKNFQSKIFDISLMDCQLQLVPLVVPHNQVNPMEAQSPLGFRVSAGPAVILRLVESSIMHNVVCIATKFETFMSNKHKGLVPKFNCGQTTHFSEWPEKPLVYKNETFFIGATGSFTLPGILPDCVYFAIDNILGLVVHGSDIKPYIVRECGQYDNGKKNNKFRRNRPRMIKYPSGSKIGWFMPKLFML